jgi:hypothetical protein
LKKLTRGGGSGANSPDSAQSLAVGILMRPVLFAVVWYSYLTKSKRVQATYSRDYSVVTKSKPKSVSVLLRHTGAVSALACMSLAVLEPASAIVSGRLYCIGGATSGYLFRGVPYSDVQIYQP